MAKGPPLLGEYNQENNVTWQLGGDVMVSNFTTKARNANVPFPSSLFGQGKLVRCIRRFNNWGSDFVGPVVAVPPPIFAQKTKNAPSPCLISGKPCIKVSREELCGLALILGIRFRWDQRSMIFKGEGAFGLDMAVTYAQNDGQWRLSLNQVARRPRHKPSKGSGYTPLFSIFMGCGLIPFARDSAGWIKAVYVSLDVLRGIKSGSIIIDIDESFIDSIEYLRRLPTSTYAQAWPHSGITAVSQHCIAGEIRDKNNTRVGSWWETVSGIAFGGLVPQTTEEVKEAVVFTLSGLSKLADQEWHLGEKVPGNISCTEALERLENNVHAQANGLDLFGEYVTERGNWPDASYAIKCENTNDAASVFGRYMTLLERLLALYTNGVNSHAKRDEIFDKTKELLEKSYNEAISPQAEENHAGENHASETHASETHASETLASESNRHYLELYWKLGDVIKIIAKKFAAAATAAPAPAPPEIDEKDCIWVAACIIAAWAKNVQTVSLAPGKVGNAGVIRLRREVGNHGREHSPDWSFSGSFGQEERVNLEDLPNVMVFG